MKNKAKRVGRAVIAAVASTEAVRAEKNLAVLIAVRVALALGASAEIVQLIQALVP